MTCAMRILWNNYQIAFRYNVSITKLILSEQSFHSLETRILNVLTPRRRQFHMTSHSNVERYRSYYLFPWIKSHISKLFGIHHDGSTNRNHNNRIWFRIHIGRYFYVHIFTLFLLPCHFRGLCHRSHVMCAICCNHKVNDRILIAWKLLNDGYLHIFRLWFIRKLWKSSFLGKLIKFSFINFALWITQITYGSKLQGDDWKMQILTPCNSQKSSSRLFRNLLQLFQWSLKVNCMQSDLFQIYIALLLIDHQIFLLES